MSKGWLIGLVLFAGIDVQAQFKLYEQGLDTYQQKKYPEAITLLNDYLDSQLRDKDLDVDIHYYLALSYFKTQSHTSAVREFDETLRLGHKNTGNIHWFMAKSYVDLKAYQDGLTEYTKAVELIVDKPNQAKLFYERAMVYDKLGSRALAVEDLQNTIAADPTHPEARKTVKDWYVGATQVAKTTVVLILDAGDDIQLTIIELPPGQ